MLDSAARTFHTVRYLRPSQIYLRAWGQMKRRTGLGRPPSPPLHLSGILAPRRPFLHHDPWNTAPNLRAGRFQFLSEERHLGFPPNWNPDVPLLWRFNLHYFAYLHLLNAGERMAVCEDWIQRNPPGAGAAWHPFPTSLRIVNWCKGGVSEPRLFASLYTQAGYISRNIEMHIPGNHLLENARALVLTGIYLHGQGEAPDWLEKGLRILRRESRVQILADGGHFERSPMYHALMLEAYLDVLNVLPHNRPERTELEDAAKRMADFLTSTTHPDGNIALFNDAAQEIAPPTDQLLSYASEILGIPAKQRDTFPDTGYFMWREAGVFLIMDGGPVGPDFLPAHAHADIFSYELSVEGLAFIVDSGVYEYAAGPMRTYARGTAAHNTLSVDGKDQVECWGSFRVARRTPPHNVTFETGGGEARFSGVFGGYGAIIGDGIAHERIIRCSAGDRSISVRDTVAGRGRHLLQSRIHVHPEVNVQISGNSAELTRNGVRVRVAAERGQIEMEDAWYCPRFGVRIPSRVLCVSLDTSLPAELAYTITWERNTEAADL